MDMAKKVGRPSKYTPQFVQMVDDYLQTCGREQTKLPKLTEFYRYIGISRQCADEWKAKYPEFGDACKRIEEAQMEELMDDGLFGGKEVNSAMAIFLLKANHGLIERSQLEIDQKVTHIVVTRGTQINGDVKIIDSETTQQLPAPSTEPQ